MAINFDSKDESLGKVALFLIKNQPSQKSFGNVHRESFIFRKIIHKRILFIFKASGFGVNSFSLTAFYVILSDHTQQAYVLLVG